MHPITPDFIVAESLVEEVRWLLSGKIREINFTYTIPADREQRCMFCGETCFPCSDGLDFYYLATIETDGSGNRRANLVDPHDCPEARRYEEFVDSPEMEEM